MYSNPRRSHKNSLEGHWKKSILPAINVYVSNICNKMTYSPLGSKMIMSTMDKCERSICSKEKLLLYQILLSGYGKLDSTRYFNLIF